MRRVVSICSAMACGRSSQQCISQNDRVIVSLIMSREDQCDTAGSRATAEFTELLAMLLNLARVAPAKFLPTRGIMPEPGAQARAGGYRLVPLIDGGIRLPDAPRPQAID